MCGIVGVIQYDGDAVDAERVRRSADLLAKRGPDDCGVWTGENAGFGHRRLSILDLSSAGHQPMVSPDGRYVIVYNGEIYNYREIRNEVGNLTGEWSGNSDTEVILASYVKWGTACLERFHGMFAFAIWDRKEKTLFAARDRMGVKPFYYHRSSGCFAFASRPRSLFGLAPSISGEIDEQALRYYMDIGFIPAPHSIYKDIHKLPPAHYLLADEGGMQLKRYWDLRQIEPDPSWERRSEDDLLDELDELFSRTVRSRMISDVPLGAFLSGGIDSSLVVAMMAKHSSSPVKTFTMGFAEKKYDESSHALAVANHLKTDHHCETLRIDDLLKLMPVFLEEFDEPFYDSSAIPTMAVSRLARKHVAVSLSGDGGDELFCGYHYYRIAQKLNPFFKLPKAVRGMAAFSAGMLPGHNCKLLAGALRQPDPVSAFTFARSIAKDFPNVLRPEVLAGTKSIMQLYREASLVFPGVLHPSEQGMRLDALFTLPDDYLQKVDVASMAFSLESREPFLDQDMVEWGMKLPLRWKLKNGTNKYLLRKLASRYVPEEILNRPKQGFAVPIDGWLRGPLRSWAEERINDTQAFSKLPLRRSAVLDLWKMHLSGARNVHPLLWAILVLIDFSENQKLSGKAVS